MLGVRGLTGFHATHSNWDAIWYRLSLQEKRRYITGHDPVCTTQLIHIHKRHKKQTTSQNKTNRWYNYLKGKVHLEIKIKIIYSSTSSNLLKEPALKTIETAHTHTFAQPPHAVWSHISHMFLAGEIGAWHDDVRVWRHVDCWPVCGSDLDSSAVCLWYELKLQFGRSRFFLLQTLQTL